MQLVILDRNDSQLWTLAPDAVALPSASAPSVTIGAVSSVAEDDTLTLTASVSGGTYDSLAYAWEVVSGGGSISGSGNSVTYNPPDVASNTSVRVRVTVTASGTGTIAASGTSDTDTDDELFTVTVIIATAPDLVVSTPTRSPSGNLTPGESFTLSAVVTNNGNGNSGSTTLRWRSSTNTTISTSDPQVGTDFVSSLSPGGTSAESIVLSAPSTPGTYYYGATVDSVTDESDTGNNASGPLTVTVVEAPAPDLVVSTPTRSPSGNLTPGQSFTLSAVVTNNGNGNSASTTLRWRQSTNSNITTSDPQVGTDFVSGLSAGGAGTETISLTAPLTPGTYYYGATVDSVTDESDTGNNASNAVTVVVQTAAQTHAVDAGDTAWAFAVPQPSVTHQGAGGSAINAGDVSWAFAVPQPSVTYQAAQGHAVNAGDVSWAFAVPQPSVTYQGAQSHAVSAGDTAWAFAVPQPSVTYHAAQAHAVSAGDVSWAFAVPQPIVTYQVGMVQPHSQTIADLTTFDASDSTRWFYNPNVTTDNWRVDDEFLADPSIPTYFAAIILTNAGVVTLRLDDLPLNTFGSDLGPELSDLFESTGRITITSESGSDLASVTVTGILDATEPYTWTPDNFQEVIDFLAASVAQGTSPTVTVRFDIGDTTPAQTHAVDAGDVSWAFAVHQPSVTHTPRVTQTHAVDAGDAAWSFAIPQPSVTYQAAQTHAINAGAISFTFAIPQPSVTHVELTEPGPQPFTVGLPNLSELGPPPRLQWLQDSPRIQLDASLVEFPANAAFFGNLQLYFDRTLPIGLRLSADLVESFGAAAPNLIDTWGLSDRALIISAGGLSIEIPGPFHSSNQTFDSGNEPYDWLPSAAKVTEIQEWMTAYMALSLSDRSATTITFDDGLGAQTHAVNAGDVSWSFAIPQPSVTHTPRVTQTHAVNAGDAAWSFDLPEPTSRVTTPVVHAVNVGEVGWSFDLPEPAVTKIVAPVAHAVDAGDAAWSFDLPEPAATHVQPSTITLNTIPDHVGEVVRMVITVGDDPDGTISTNGQGKWWSRITGDGTGGAGIGSIEGDPLIYDDSGSADVELDLDRVWYTGTDFRLNRDPLNAVATDPQENFDGYFGSETDLVLFVETADYSASLPIIVNNWRSIGPHYLNLTPNAELAALCDAVRVGTVVNLVIANAALASAVTQHAVNAGDAAWSFDLPEPTPRVTTPVVHAVNVGEVGWSFDLPETTVTKVVAPVAHAVNAGDVSWAFGVPQPTVTRVAAPVAHAVDAGDAAWSFDLPEPAATHVQPSTITLNTIPAHVGEVVRMVITVGDDPDGTISTNGQGKWWSRITGDGTGGTGIGSIEGDPLIYDDSGSADVELDLDRVWYNGTDFRLNRDPLNAIAVDPQENFDGYFGSVTHLVLFVETADYSASLPIIENNWRSIGPHYLNLTPNAELTALCDAVRVGTVVNLVIANAILASAVTQHAVNAGDAAWSFDLPEPTPRVTTPVVHAVNVGEVGWSFDLPEPGITDTRPPLATPANLTATNPTEITVTLKFDAVTDADSYRIEYQVDPGGQIYSVTTTDTQHILFPLQSGTDYLVRVVALAAGRTESSPTASVSFTTQAVVMVPNRLFQILVDWDGDGSFGNANSDVSADVIAIPTVRRGRNYGSQILAYSVAGRLEAVLRNDVDDKYNHANGASPLFGLARAGKAIRYSLWHPTNATWDVQWTGTLDDVERIQRTGGRHVVKLHAFGVFARLREVEISVPIQVSTDTVPFTAGDAAVTLLSAAGFSDSSQRGPITGTREIERWWVNSQKALSAWREVEDTELGFAYETKDGLPAMASGGSRLSASSRTPVARFSEALLTGYIHAEKIDPEDPLKDVYNEIRVPVKTYEIDNEAVLWRLNRTISLTSGEMLTLIATYPTAKAPRNVLAVEEWTDLAPVIDYTANSQADGMGTDLTPSLSVSVVDTATSRAITLENIHATDDLVVTRLQTRGRSLTEGDDVTIQVLSQESIDELDGQKRTYPVPPQFISDLNEAKSYANFLLSLLKDPHTRATVVFEAAENMDIAAELDLSDRVVLEVSGGQTDMFVEAIAHRQPRGGRHRITLTLSPAEPYGQVIVLDRGPGLGTGILAP